MDDPQPGGTGSSTVTFTVLSVTPMRAGKLFALAAVEINIDRVLIEIHGIRAIRTATGATRVELPTFRDATGQPRTAIVLPDEIYRPIGDAVLEVLIERGIAKRRLAAVSPLVEPPSGRKVEEGGSPE
jgi:hypothetical protein